MLGLRLKKLRKEKNILQKDVAKRLNISASAYGYYEQGKRDPDTATLIKLAQLFDVSVDYLLGLTNIKKPYSLNDEQNNKSISDNDLALLEIAIKIISKYIENRKYGSENKSSLKNVKVNDDL